MFILLRLSKTLLPKENTIKHREEQDIWTGIDREKKGEIKRDEQKIKRQKMLKDIDNEITYNVAMSLLELKTHKLVL